MASKDTKHIEWRLRVSEETDRSVRDYLASGDSEESDLDSFVDHAVRREVLRRTVRDFQEQSVNLSSEDADALANEAVAWARANRP